MHMYIFHDLFNSNIICLNDLIDYTVKKNDLIDYVIKIHVNTYLNHHINFFFFFRKTNTNKEEEKHVMNCLEIYVFKSIVTKIYIYIYIYIYNLETKGYKFNI